MIGGLIKSIALRLLFQSPSLCIYSLSMLIKCLSFAHCTALNNVSPNYIAHGTGLSATQYL